MVSIRTLGTLACVVSLIAVTLASCVSAGGVTGRVVPRGEHQISLNAGGSAVSETTLPGVTSGLAWRMGIYDHMDLSLELQGGGLGLLYRYQVLGKNHETDPFALSLGVGGMLRTVLPFWPGARLGVYFSYHPMDILGIYSHVIMHTFLLGDALSYTPLLAAGVRFGRRIGGFLEFNLLSDINDFASVDDYIYSYNVLLGGYIKLGRE